MGKHPGDQKSKQEITITYMMMCIITVFLITQFPYYLKAILVLTGIIKSNFFSFVPVLHLTTWIFVILNSTVNTIIYCIFNKKFRDVLFLWFPSKLRNRLSGVSTSVATLKSNKQHTTKTTTNNIECNI